MKITDIEIKSYLLPLDPPFNAAWDFKPRKQFCATVVQVHTDEGITGIGSGDLMLGFQGHEYLFQGHDPFDIERHNQILDNIDFHYGRCWPLDLALWDLMGKATGKPVYQLLGGKTDKVRAYLSWGEVAAPEVRAERAIRAVEEGFKAVKIRFHHADVRDDIKVVEAVRAAVGDKLEIMVDANQGWRMPHDIEKPWDLKKALQVAKELEKLNVYWLEEPLPHYDYDNMARLRQMTPLRIAGGEMNRRWHDVRDMCEKGSLDVFQMDVCYCGGITKARNYAEIIRASGSVFSPHTWGNGISLLANLHVAAGLDCATYLEYPYDAPAWSIERRDFLQTSETMTRVDKDGYFVLSDRPGLGFELDQQALQKYEIKQAVVW